MSLLPSLRSLVPGRFDARVRVPHDREGLTAITTVGAEDDPASAGLTERDVERMWRAAVALYRTGVHPSVALTVRRHGRVVVNRAIGHARGNGPHDPPSAEKEPARPDTPYCLFSASKGFTATVVHALAERGHFDLDDQVAEYVDGYGAHGKQDTTIRHVLTHRAGVPYLPRHVTDLDRLDEPDFLRRAVADLRPVARPGKRLIYHAVSGGFVLEEVVRGATGRGLREHLADLVLDPLGFRWSNYGVAAQDVPLVAPAYRTGPTLIPPVSTYVAQVLSAPLGEVVAMSTDPRFLTGVIPSANVVSTAEETARFYDVLAHGGTLDGVTVMRPETLRAATRTTARLVPDLGLGGLPVRYGTGYMLGAERLSPFGQHADRAFGHIGLMHVLGWADPERALAASLMTSGKVILYEGIPTWLNVPTVIARTVDRLPAAKQPF